MIVGDQRSRDTTIRIATEPDCCGTAAILGLSGVNLWFLSGMGFDDIGCISSKGPDT